MYRLILWASVITLPFNIHSQEDSNGNSSRFKIGIRAGAGVDHRFIIQDSTNKSIYDTIYNFFKEEELPAIGFYSGIYCLYTV